MNTRVGQGWARSHQQPGVEVLLPERRVGGARGHELGLHPRHQRVARLRAQAPRGRQPRAHIRQVPAIGERAACHTAWCQDRGTRGKRMTLTCSQEGASASCLHSGGRFSQADGWHV